jgi:hypothetical protein
MITEQEAVERAWELDRIEKLEVRGVRLVRMDTPPEFLAGWGSRGAAWSVLFDLDVPPDRVLSPDVVSILVDRQTGEAMVIRGP